MITEEQSFKNKIYSLKTNPLQGNFKCFCDFEITGDEITKAVLSGNDVVAVLKMVKKHGKYFPQYHVVCDCEKMGVDDKPTTDWGRMNAVILGKWEEDVDEETHGDDRDYGNWYNDFYMRSNTPKDIEFKGHSYEILKSSEHFGITYHVIRSRESITKFTDSSKTIYLIDEISYNEKHETGKLVDKYGNHI
jgi:hypothetical protein